MNYNDSTSILEKQNEYIKKLEQYQYKLLNYLKEIIQSKTGEKFNSENINNYYIYTNNCYKIIFNVSNGIFGLMHDNKILLETFILNDIIYKYLQDTNRLSLVVHSQVMDDDMENINNIFNNIHL